MISQSSNQFSCTTSFLCCSEVQWKRYRQCLRLMYWSTLHQCTTSICFPTKHDTLHKHQIEAWHLAHEFGSWGHRRGCSSACWTQSVCLSQMSQSICLLHGSVGSQTWKRGAQYLSRIDLDERYVSMLHTYTLYHSKKILHLISHWVASYWYVFMGCSHRSVRKWWLHCWT